jgi:hypothetical protein
VAAAVAIYVELERGNGRPRCRDGRSPSSGLEGAATDTHRVPFCRARQCSRKEY